MVNGGTETDRMRTFWSNFCNAIFFRINPFLNTNTIISANNKHYRNKDGDNRKYEQ